MSEQTRESLVSKLFFQDTDSKTDLLNPDLTSTNLIAILVSVLAAGYNLEITAVRTDHHPDGYLGVHSHQAGRAVDCWPLNSPKMGDYMDPNTSDFMMFLRDTKRINQVAQIGLGGSAFTTSNVAVLGSLGFQDNGADHVHIGT
jgi:hypothetical protein